MYEEPVNSQLSFSNVPKKLVECLSNLGEPHLDSFNQMLYIGLKNAIKYQNHIRFLTATGEKVSLYMEHIQIKRPQVPNDVIDVKNKYIYPAEARLAHKTYQGLCQVSVGWSVDGLVKAPIVIDVGSLPIMVKSKLCNLYKMSPEELVKYGEHESEYGGHFVIKGNEKVLRMLLVTRRNFPVSIKRSSWKDRGSHFSDLGVMVRSVRSDETSVNSVLHYVNNGTAKLMFSNMKVLSYVPVCLILKCLVDFTDEEIFRRLIRGFEHDQYYLSRVQTMLQDVHNEGLHSHSDCKNYLGQVFRSLYSEVPSWEDPSSVADLILKESILIHLETAKEKFDLLVFMIQKLFQCAQGKFKIENVDSLIMQELLLPGQLYQKVLLENINVWLQNAKKMLLKKLPDSNSIVTENILASCLRYSSSSVPRGMESFLATGSINSRDGLGLMQNTGLCVIAENINRMRFMAHFRAVHRGSYFTTMRTTEARQLLPDAWGFICPVHTPDGSPCGLLNHLSVTCKVSRTTKTDLYKIIPTKLIELGMLPIDTELYNTAMKLFAVMLDGKLLGYIRATDAPKIANQLRFLKVEGILSPLMEIVSIPQKIKGQYPGLYIFVGPARLMRPVQNLALEKIEYIGTMEQVYMEVAVDTKEIYPEVTTHMELNKTNFLSNLANLIPMPDYNQSPRNMYQCQMGKQTMGTPCLNWSKQAATKLYRLQTPTTPLFRPIHYDNVKLDDFAMGTNAIVAVISYTGYDMEDAMIINKAAFERGFAYGSIYKSKFVELEGTSYFARNPSAQELLSYLDNDGLPQAGTHLSHGCPLYSFYDTEERRYKVVKMDEKEDCIVDSIRYCGSLKTNDKRLVCIIVRIPRPPTIGDKFASRAGQKGICSQKYPAEDLPFTETGLIPDIVFNPHGFPSRMTIAMMIETMAGKSAALHGVIHDATPFRFSEKNTAIDYFGKMLEVNGYNYYGTERLYSGIEGFELSADIFIGVVHYQRLRHMVFDKWQVRSTGPVDAITHQPIKGRKRGGGVRFGEMERDALISHGAAFLLQDRLFHNSDKSNTLVCSVCGSILSTLKEIVKRSIETGKRDSVPETCRLCGNNCAVSYIEIPSSFKYLVTELSSVNINAKLKLIKI